MENIFDRSVDLGEFVPQPDDDMIVCRCEEVTKGQIRQAVHDGLCQGQTCAKLVKRIVANELKVSMDVLEPASSRAPMRPIEMEVFARENNGSLIETENDINSEKSREL